MYQRLVKWYIRSSNLAPYSTARSCETRNNCFIFCISSYFTFYSSKSLASYRNFVTLFDTICVRKVEYVVRGWRQVLRETPGVAWVLKCLTSRRRARAEWRNRLRGRSSFTCIDQSLEVCEFVKTWCRTDKVACSLIIQDDSCVVFSAIQGRFMTSPSTGRLYPAPTTQPSQFQCLCEGEVQLRVWASYLHRHQSHCVLPSRLCAVMGKPRSCHSWGRLLLTAEAWVRAQITPYGICCGCSGAEIGFSPSPSVLSCQYYSTVALLFLHVSWWMDQFPPSRRQ